MDDMGSKSPTQEVVQPDSDIHTVHAIGNEKLSDVNQVEKIDTNNGNLQYTDADEEPELHAKTFIALAALFMLNLTLTVAVQGPPIVLSYIGNALDAQASESWVSNAFIVTGAVLGPVISFASDTFQARKFLLVGCCLVAAVGAGIAPGSKSVGRLLAAQCLIGVGFGAIPLGYAVPSEIVPRKWRPMIQAIINFGSTCGAIVGPFAAGALTNSDPVSGWRNFWWFELGLWLFSAIAITLGYRPPKRHTRLDHLTTWQKLGCLDLPGFALLTIGLTLFLTGLGVGGALYPWKNAHALAPLVIGLVVILLFALYEWKGTKTGILHHDLFRGGQQGRTFSICIVLIFLEGAMLFAFSIFYPQLTVVLFQNNPLRLVVRTMPWQVAAAIAGFVFGYTSTRFRTIREPLFAGYLIWTIGLVGLATLQPNSSTRVLIFSAIAGFGFGSPLILITAAVQFYSPHRLIATATAVSTSARAIACAAFTAIYFATLGSREAINLPKDVARAGLQAGLPPQFIGQFIGAIAGSNATALNLIPGINQAIIIAGEAANKQAYTDSVRPVYIIAAALGALACILCYWVGPMHQHMNYKVDAPVEELHGKNHGLGKLGEA